jgi:hypothetical protein
MEKKFKDPIHDEDTFEVKKNGVYISIMLESGTIQPVFLTHKAFAEIAEAVKEVTE